MKSITRIWALALALTAALCCSAATRGDITGDGAIDIADVNRAINIMLGKAQAVAAADVTSDGKVDIADVNVLINVMLGKATLDDEEDSPGVGIYMGITGFNDQLYVKPMGLLNDMTRGEYTAFVDGLPMRAGTLLYWGVHQSLKELAQTPTPQDLTDIVMVTFTDGLDQGSLMMNSEYRTSMQYLNALHSLLQGRMKGIQLKSYTIGLRGTDVTDTQMFAQNLTQLATNSDYATEIYNIGDMAVKFNEVAQLTRDESQSQDISIRMPGTGSGTKVRFTFDYSLQGSDSQRYIEGTFYLGDRTLRNVKYVGMTSDAGTLLYGKQDGIFVTFDFANTRTAAGAVLPMDNVQMWTHITSTNRWQRNSEFTSADNTLTSITHHSILLMLNLDCSSSLGTDFSIMKTKVNEFIDALASIAPSMTYKVGGVTFDMVPVAGGSFTMGATGEQGTAAESDERPAHTVKLSDFAIGQTEVTQALWQAVMGSNPSKFTGDLNRPVDNVSWNQCQQFITKLNEMTGQHFRLPTEAEWEYAARGGQKGAATRYAGGDDLQGLAWYSATSSQTTHPVATKAQNELGLYDMSGNVWEFCQDHYGTAYYSTSPATNPTGPTSGSYRVKRGGGWDSQQAECRVSNREYYGPGYTKNINGLRLAM